MSNVIAINARSAIYVERLLSGESIGCAITSRDGNAGSQSSMTSGSNGGSATVVSRATGEQVTSLDQQLEQMESLALRHYPDNEAERNACLVRLLKERLRAYHMMLQPLPVRQMGEEK